MSSEFNDEYAPYEELFGDPDVEAPEEPRESATVDFSQHWVTKDGRVLPITKMTDSHLINCIRFLKKKG